MKIRHLDTYRNIGLKIGYYRRKSGMTQEELAEKINRHPVTIANIEGPNCDYILSFEIFLDIAEVLNVAPYKLLKDDE